MMKGYCEMLVRFFCRMIPRWIPNAWVLCFFELLRRLQQWNRPKRQKQMRAVRFQENEAAFEGHKASINRYRGFIEDQHAYGDLHFGSCQLSYSGCEIIAMYNAIYDLNGHHRHSLPRLIREFERNGMVLSGRFGTSPKALAAFLRRQGYEVEMTSRKQEFDLLAAHFHTLILTMYNDGENLLEEVHTVCISRDRNGKYLAHNVYCSGKLVGPADDLSSLIRQIHDGKARGIALIGINLSPQRN